MASNCGSNQVRNIILERLPPTLVLFAAADIILFILALFSALALSRRYGSIFDKLTHCLNTAFFSPRLVLWIFLILILCCSSEQFCLSAAWWMLRRPPLAFDYL